VWLLDGVTLQGDVMDLRSDDGDGEARSVEAADGTQRSRVRVLIARAAKAVLGGGVSRAKRCVDVTGALGRAVAGEDCDGDHGAAAQEVHDDGEESEKALASEEAREQDSEDAVQHNRARHALNRLLPSWNGLVAIGLHGEEVTVDTEDDASAAELERVEEGRANAQGSAADSHCD
jgi:hypothetical protein